MSKYRSSRPCLFSLRTSSPTRLFVGGGADIAFVSYWKLRNEWAADTVVYIFSQNHINKLIEQSIDFSDEDVLAHFIAFLKVGLNRVNSRSTLE